MMVQLDVDVQGIAGTQWKGTVGWTTCWTRFSITGFAHVLRCLNHISELGKAILYEQGFLVS